MELNYGIKLSRKIMQTNFSKGDIRMSSLNTAHLHYLQNLANQPLGEWEGFFRTPVDGMNFGLRFQLAFVGYAIYGLARLTPAYRVPYVTALYNLIEKMLHPAVWAYWFQGAIHNKTEAETPDRLQKVVQDIHSRLSIGGTIPPDPCLQGNVQYSGHLASLLGFYQLLSGDDYFNRVGFKLQAEANGQSYSFPYTYTELATHIHAQMQSNYFHGLCCEPGRAYAACNNHACISNLLHDELYGTNFADANAAWRAWIEGRMLRHNQLPLPTANGLLSVAYMPGLHLPIPVSFNLTDAWGLAFMAAWQPELVQREYPRFRPKLKNLPGQALKLGSRELNEKAEISTTSLNSGFAFVLARTQGDIETADGLLRFADDYLQPTFANGGLFYADSHPAAYVTALYALGATLPESSSGLYELVRWQPNFYEPYLASLSEPNVTVTKAIFSTERGLQLLLDSPEKIAITLEIGNCDSLAAINFNGKSVDKVAMEVLNGYNSSGYYFDVDSGKTFLRLLLLPGENRITVH